MRSFVATGLIASAWLFAAPAIAEDAADPEFNWSGAYVGVDAGYVWGNVDTSLVAKGKTLENTFKPSGIFGDIHAGYNIETDSILVFGFEGDIQYPMPNDSVINGDVDLKWTGSARARVGYAFDRFMPYATGGVAVASADYSFISHGWEAKNMLVGWTVGSGLEYAATNNLILRTEFRYTDYGEADDDVLGDGQKISVRSSDIRVGASFKF